MPGFYIGRQPIFTPRLKVFGYELIGQPAQTGNIKNTDIESEARQSIYKSFSEIGLDVLVGNLWALIHFDPDYLYADKSLHFSPTRMIIETSPCSEQAGKLEPTLEDLEAAGFQIVLEKVTCLEDISELARNGRIVKIDVSSYVRPEIAWLATQFKNMDVRLLATGVQTMDDFEFCSRLGFQLLQGRFLYHPNPTVEGKIDSSRVTVLRALAVTADENSDFVQIDHIISQDIGITYKLLRLVNSVYYGTNETIKSLQQAISMIGRDQLRGWITLILMSTVDDKPTELTGTAVIRAKMCELLARAMGRENVEEFFLIGLLSIVDALMNLPMEDVINKLSLNTEQVDGLLHQKGVLGQVLEIVRKYENGEWNALGANGLDPETICRAYVDSISWSGTILNTMKNG